MDAQKWLVGVVPGLSLALSHWFPWRRWLRRDLGLLERYTLGVGAIVGVAVLVLRAERVLPGRRAADLVGLSAMSGGMGTLLAWGIDIILAARRFQRFQQDLEDALNELSSQPQRGQGVDTEIGG